MRLLFLCLLAVVCFIYFDFVDGLKTNDPGACVVTRSVKKTKLRTYIVKYKCRGKICSTRKTKRVEYTVAQNDTVCCAGWTYSGDLDTCSPLCSTGCVGGRCIAPETCQCDPPAIINQDTKNSCYLPICEPPCKNGNCISNNTCICSEGFQKVNNFCEPKCDSCANGHCTAPNVCECFEGYANVGGLCKPLCQGCDNGVCVTPNVCECKDGYLRNATSAVCYKPCPEDCGTCDLDGNCRDGVCGSNPNEVICCDGYSWAIVAKKEVCKPICRPSCGRHGMCVSYNQCKCKPPYVFRRGTCLPPPTCDFECVNGKCTDDNTCTCDTGYTPKNESACEPVCKQTCVNSVCTGIDRCDCLEGFRSKNQWECEPVCSECENGACTGPNVCTCNKGYVNVDGKCIPECKGNCLHGHCTEPNECTCDVGYENDPLDKLTCRPICETKCVNATCVAPNRCLCLPGYTSMTHGSVCKPKCDYCIDGACVGPNICRCHKGYAMTGIKCKPVCTKPCVNGFCSEPDKCSCNIGYEPDDKVINACKPHCSKKCINGSCVRPDICECLDGFEKDSDNTCKPKCSSCEFGQCLSPGICMCNEGYIRSNGKCKPKCLACDNGECVSPGECQCNEGYFRSNDTCKPKCSDCEDGYCETPEECTCNTGYIKSNGTCRPVCSETCINGYCKSPNECSCLEGYEMNSTDSSICYKPCSGPCLNGVCNIDGECICNPGFELEFNTCLSNNETMNCDSCGGECEDSECSCADGRPCSLIRKDNMKSTGLAGLELTWILGACIGSLLIIFVVTILIQMWRRRPNYKTTQYPGDNANGSVVFTAPGTLNNRILSNSKLDVDLYNGIDEDLEDENEDLDDENEHLDDENEQTKERLLSNEIIYEDEKL